MRVVRMYFLIMTEVSFILDDEFQATLAMYSSKRQADYFAEVLNNKYSRLDDNYDTIHFSVDTTPVERESARFIPIPKQFKYDDLLGCRVEALGWEAEVVAVYDSNVLAEVDGYREHIEFTDIEGVFKYEE